MSMNSKPRKGSKIRLRDQDPHLEREREKYAQPVPSREFILEVMTRHGVPVTVEELAGMLSIRDDEMNVFQTRLRAMERDGELMRNRKKALCIVEKLDLLTGVVQGHADGFGFFIPDDDSGDLFLGPREMHKALHGDRVMAREIGLDRRGRREASIVEVLERRNQRVVGRLYNEQGILFVVAEDKRISQDILIPRGKELGAKAGQVVVVELIQQPSKHADPLGEVAEILGDHTDAGIEIEIALRKHELPYEFPKAVQKLEKQVPASVSASDIKKGRKDIRDLPLVTIDGETARDFDDAVYCKRVGKGFRLWVAIADVSYYVEHGDPIDREGLSRGNSVYFPRRVIPMLPEALSNGICSLNPKVDRLCMVCEMDVTATGTVKGYRFYPGVMNSKARLTYTQVAEALQDPNSDGGEIVGELLPQLESLYALYQALRKAREKRGAIDFETVETQMIFTPQGKIERIVPVQRNEAHRVIEECMLAANVCASDLLLTNEHPALFRIHEGPTPEKLQKLRDFLKGFGLPLGGGEKPSAKDYAVLLEKIKLRPDAQLLQTVMLRSLQQAVYSPNNVGHFGLAYEAYTHFTSPIRRYPDLLVHRSIKAVLENKRYEPGNWQELGKHCSLTERRADEATRDVETWLKAYYMQDKIGESFEGTISGVTSFGAFVALDGVYVEGLLHITELGRDYFKFDPAQHELRGERTNKRYRLSDRVRVTVARVDMETTKIDFVLADADEAPPPAPSKRKPARKR